MQRLQLTSGTQGSTATQVEQATMALIDGHVHVHDAFDVAAMLDHASAHRASVAQRLHFPPASPGVLMLTESQGAMAFARMTDKIDQHIGRWRVLRTGEVMSLRLETDDAAPLVVIAGRQVVTAEHLEVLALGTVAIFKDGQPIRSVIEQVHAAGALVVIPWGFGKWTGARGRVVLDVLTSPEATRLFVGDNGGRLSTGPEPALFAVARQHGIPILPGTDPFPFAGQVDRPLSYGFALSVDVTNDRPADTIKRQLLAERAQPQSFGYRTGLASFIRSQVAMQVQKRLAKTGFAR